MDELGDSTFNMSLQTLKRMNDIIVIINQLGTTEFFKGNPLYYQLLQAIRCLYSEVRPHLKDGEKKIGDAYRSIFKLKFADNKMLIDFTGGRLEVKEAAVPILEEWLDWIRDMMFVHKLSMAIGDDPGDVIE